MALLGQSCRRRLPRRWKTGSGDCLTVRPAALPRKENLAKPSEEHVGGQADNANHHDGCVDVIEIAVASLLVNKKVIPDIVPTTSATMRYVHAQPSRIRMSV
mgnify:CR=1 FL=1